MPTAMPSGRLCMVTARISLVVRFRPLRGPSSLRSKCIWGMSMSSTSKNSMPARNPITAGRKARVPMPSLWDSAGCSRLKNDADTITPAANPVRARLSFSPISFCKKNTQAAPRPVPMKGIMIPSITCRFKTGSPLSRRGAERAGAEYVRLN